MPYHYFTTFKPIHGQIYFTMFCGTCELGWANFSKSSQIEPLFSYSMCMGKIRSHTFDLAPFIGNKNALQNGITIGFLDFRKYVKRLDGN